MWFSWKNDIQHFATYGDKVTERGADFQKLDQCVKMPVYVLETFSTMG